MSARMTDRWLCENCAQRFDRHKAGKRVHRFCSNACRYDAVRKRNGNPGAFKSGSTPWNKGQKGLHLSPSTEWKKGCESLRKLPVGTVRVRHRRREKHPRAFVKVAEPNVWHPRAIVVWERENGPVPKGCVIHHRDHNPLNDDLENLVLMTRAEHAREHNKDSENARYGTGAAALRGEKFFIGIERNEAHFRTSVARLTDVARTLP